MIFFGGPQPATSSDNSEPIEEGWQTRNDLPASINPTGTLWQVEKNWTFNGTAGSPPPAPWHTGTEWAGAHESLGGHVWRDQVNLDSMAYLNGTGSLILKLDWDETNSTAVGAYLITDQDGSVARPDDYRLDPNGEDGVWLEFTAVFPEDQPEASWGALWTYATGDDTSLVGGQPTTNEEIDICEKIGIARPYYEGRFHTNTHGRRDTLVSDCAADEGLAQGEGFAPSVWGGQPPNDGQPHVWGIMWVPGANGTQEFFYDGHKYATRPKSGDTIHSKPHGLRLSWETEYPNPWGSSADPATEGSYFPREIRVDTVRVIRRRLPPAPPSGDKPNVLIGAANLGLSSTYQDQYHTSDPPDIAGDLWGFSPSARNTGIAPPSTAAGIANSVGMATVTVGGKPARRVNRWRMPQGGWFGWAHTMAVTGSAKAAVAVDIFYPTTWRYQGSTGKRDGKTPIGFSTMPSGTPTFHWHNASDGGNRYPWEQGGGSGGACAHHGLNFSSVPGGDPYFKLYSHALGYSGIASKRSKVTNGVYTGQAGILHPNVGPNFTIQRGVWTTVEMFIQVDTNGRNGIIRVWTTANGVTTLRINLTDLDLGGMVGTRNYATMPRQDNFTWGATPQSLVIASGRGALVRGLMSRHMPGGWPGGDTQADRNNWWNIYSTGELYTYNWRFWQG